MALISTRTAAPDPLSFWPQVPHLNPAFFLVSDSLSFTSTFQTSAGCSAGHQKEDMAAFFIGRGADVDAADDKGVSACLVAAATGASSASLSMAHRCFGQATG